MKYTITVTNSIDYYIVRHTLYNDCAFLDIIDLEGQKTFLVVFVGGDIPNGLKIQLKRYQTILIVKFMLLRNKLIKVDKNKTAKITCIQYLLVCYLIFTYTQKQAYLLK